MDNTQFQKQKNSSENDLKSEKKGSSSEQGFNYFYENKQILQFSDLETKASSHLSNGTHETSFEFSESSFENQVTRADEYFREELILQRKICKQQLILRQYCFTFQFSQHIIDLLSKFTQHPHSNSFQSFLQNIIKPQIKIFQNEQAKNSESPQKNLTLKQVILKLIFEGKYQFFIHTFDVFICPLTFFIVLIVHWIQPFLNYSEKDFLQSGVLIKNNLKCNEIMEFKARTNIIAIVKNYVLSHSQEINSNQVLFLVCLYFLDTLKTLNQQESDSITFIQRDLVRDVKIFRKIRKIETNFSKQTNSINFQSKLAIFEQKHSFISSYDTTFNMLVSHTSESFSGISLQKIYKPDGKKENEYRNQYQIKKDVFCLWVLNNLLRNEKKSNDILYNSGMYIIRIMSMLKKLKAENNIEGISYLVPIIANIKSMLPKAWRHVINRRPEIQIKFNQYTNLMLQHRYKIDHLGQNNTVWFETLFITAEKITKNISKKYIDISELKTIYTEFMSHFLHSRQKCKQRLCQTKFQQILQNEIEVGFNFGLIENYLLKKFNNGNNGQKKDQIGEAWNDLIARANRINENITESFVSDFYDYWFVGSREIYNQVDL